MSFEADLKSHLQGVAAVSSLVNDRIYPQILPEGATLPAVTYTLVFGQPENSLDGFTSGLTRFSVQLDCWAKTFGAAVALALAVRDRMNTNASTFSTVLLNYPALDDYEPDTKRYRRALECACWFKE